MAPPRKVTAVTVVSLSSLVTGMLVIIGWEFNISCLQTVFPGFVAMKFNAAICFMLLGAALLLTQFPLKKYNTLAFLLLSSAIILIGAISLAAYLFHFNTALDQLFITDTASIAIKYPFPGRMAPNTAACFVVFGLSFFGFCSKSKSLHTVSQYLLHAITAMSAMSIVGYLYGLSLFYNLSLVGAMAVHSAILFFFLSVIASLLHPTLGITPWFTGRLVGNAMARKVVLLLIFIVIAFGAIRIEAIRYRLFSEQTGISLLVICFIGFGLALIGHTANWLNKFDTQRQDAEEEIKVMNEELEKRVEERSASLRKLLEKLRESESKFRTAFEHSAMGMALVSLQGQWLKVNKRLCDMVGYREHELLSMSFNSLTHPDDQGVHLEAMDNSAMRKNEAYRVEKRYICKDGTVVWVSINLATVINKKGGPVYFVSQFEDITERKKAERHLKKAYQQIQEHVNSITDIAWKQSHLVRSPLANLKGLVEILKGDPADKDALKYIQFELERLDTAIIEMAEDACGKGAAEIVVKKRLLSSPFAAAGI